MFSEEEHERKICHLVGYCSHYSRIFIAFPFAVLLFSYFIFYLVKARALRCGQAFDILFNSSLNISSLSRSCVFLFFFIYLFFSYSIFFCLGFKFKIRMLIVDVPMKVAFVSSSRIGAKTIYTIMPITLNKLFIGDRFFSPHSLSFVLLYLTGRWAFRFYFVKIAIEFMRKRWTCTASGKTEFFFIKKNLNFMAKIYRVCMHVCRESICFEKLVKA